MVKKNIPIVVATGLVVVFLLLAGITAPLLESPERTVHREIDLAVEQAQRILQAYDTAGIRLAGGLESGRYEPASPNPDDADPLADVEAMHQRALADLQRPYAELAERTGGPDWARLSSAGEAPNYQKFKDDLDRLEALLKEGFDIIDVAVALNKTSGSETVSGREHPAATRLKALLLYHQADLARRRSAVHRARAEAERTEFRALAGRWSRTDGRLQALQRGLLGGAAVPSATIPAARDDAQPGATPSPAKKQSTGKGGILSRLLRSVLPGGGAEKPPADPGDAQPVPENEPPDAPEPIVIEAQPTFAQRAAELGNRQTELAPQIDRTEAEIKRLGDRIAKLETALAKAREQAKQAETEMMALEDGGVDAADPDALDRFVKAYEAAATANRKATREAAALEHGAVRNARPDTEDDEELLTAPLAPADPGQEMTPEPGLVTLRTELAAAEEQLAAQIAMRTEIARQIEALGQDEAGAKARVKKLLAARAKLTAELQACGVRVVAEVIEAEAATAEALNTAQNAGPAAARNALNAAGTRNRQIREFYTKQDPEGQAPRTDYLQHHVSTLSGDFQYLTALIESQRAEDLERQGRMITRAQAMGIPSDQLLPEGTDAASAPKPAYLAAEAEAAAAEALANANQAAQAALENYTEVSQRFDAWVLQANIAGVEYLLAGLATDEATAAEHRNKALDIYQRIPTDQPAGKRYRTLIDRLAQGQ